jgi:pimeloyl-ACP methyl ester carboxylesterase
LAADIRGRCDESTPGLRLATRSATLGTLRILEGAGHYPHVECPAELVAVVTSFLLEDVRA